jgi:hypothetical protein
MLAVPEACEQLVNGVALVGPEGGAVHGGNHPTNRTICRDGP